MVRLRRARPVEAQVLTDLAIRSKRSWGYSEEFMKNVLPDMVVHPSFLEDEHGIVAEENGETFGYAIVRVDGREAFLRDLFVEPAHFRKGVGSALFLESVRFARDCGAVTLKLFGDPNAIGFYEHFGMQKIGDEPSIVGGGRTLPVMLSAIDVAPVGSKEDPGPP